VTISIPSGTWRAPFGRAHDEVVDVPHPRPGGFATSGPFTPRPGTVLTPAKFHAVYGVSNGPGPLPYHGPSVAAIVFGAAVLAAIVLALVSTISRKG
jgi:hypothetical protein